MFPHSHYYQTISRLIGFLPLKRPAAATWLMRRPGLQTAPIRTPYGFWVIIPLAQSSWTTAYNLKELDVQLHLNGCLNRADAFVDCGANLGWYILQASTHPNIHEMIAVEPVRRSVQYIELLKAINDLKRVRIIEGCVTDQDGPISFVFEQGAFSEVGYVSSSYKESRCATLPGYTLETILSIVRGSKICLKVDVEGHETSVLASAHPTTLSRVASALIEVHLYKFADPCAELRWLCELLAAIGTPKFLFNPLSIYPGWFRLLRRLLSYYPAQSMPIDEVCALIARSGMTDLFIVVQRERTK